MQKHDGYPNYYKLSQLELQVLLVGLNCYISDYETHEKNELLAHAKALREELHAYIFESGFRHFAKK